MSMPKAPVYESTKMDSHVYVQELTALRKEMKCVKDVIKNKKENHYHVTSLGLMVQQKDLMNQIDYLSDNLQF
jgi:hypothetical protein